MKLTDTNTENFEANKFTKGICLDLAKAFNVIDHKLLLGLHKVNYYGIKRVSHRPKWFTSYLTNRKKFT